MLLAHTSVAMQVVPWLIIAAGFVGAAWVNQRGHTGDAVAYLQNSNKVLHDESRELKKERLTMVAEIAVLRERTDVTVAINPLRVQMDAHERRAEERHQGLLTILNLIAEKLGKEAMTADESDT